MLNVLALSRGGEGKTPQCTPKGRLRRSLPAGAVRGRTVRLDARAAIDNIVSWVDRGSA